MAKGLLDQCLYQEWVCGVRSTDPLEAAHIYPYLLLYTRQCFCHAHIYPVSLQAGT